MSPLVRSAHGRCSARTGRLTGRRTRRCRAARSVASSSSRPWRRLPSSIVAPAGVATRSGPPAADVIGFPPDTTFYGRGWGHGVGMSQHGARGRALAGQTAARSSPTTSPGRRSARSTRRPRSGCCCSTGSPRPPAHRYRLRARRDVDDRGRRDNVPGQRPADGRPGERRRVELELRVMSSGGAVLHAIGDERRRSGSGRAAAATSSSWRRSRRRTTPSGPPAGEADDHGPGHQHPRDGHVPAGRRPDGDARELAGRGAPGAVDRGPLVRCLPAPPVGRRVRRLRRHPLAGLPRGRGRGGGNERRDHGTAGAVVKNGAAIANAMFHSTGGGATENNEFVFVSASGAIVSTPVSYLRGSMDRQPDGSAYDAGAPYATWQTGDVLARRDRRDLQRRRAHGRRLADEAGSVPAGRRAGDPRDADRVARNEDRLRGRVPLGVQREPAGRRSRDAEHARRHPTDPLTAAGT